MMNRNYTTSTRVNKPVAEVFNAVISKDSQSQYFLSEASSDLTVGETVRWRWHHHDGLSVFVRKIVENELVHLTLDSKEWEKTTQDAYDVLVSFEFERADNDSTMLKISEQGWRTDPEGLKGSHDNCGGWTNMAMCLKAWIEHDIDLR